MTAMATYVGFDPRRDARLVQPPSQEAMQLLADGKIDAMLGFPPEPQELRTRKIGHVVVSTRADRPWSQYFCCMAVANVTFVKKYPVATKRMLRAFMKAADLCALEPDRVARFLVDRDFREEPRLRRAGPERDSLDAVAGLRPGRFDALLRAPTPRDGDDEDESAEDSRRQHQLALHQRIEEGAEDLADRNPLLTVRLGAIRWRLDADSARARSVTITVDS